MATLSCLGDGRKTQEERFFTYSQKDPNNLTFCVENPLNICGSPQGNPDDYQTDTGYVLPGNAYADLGRDSRGNGIRLSLNCANLVDWKLNYNKDVNFENKLLETGCPIYTSESGTRYTKCSFSSQVMPTFSDCSRKTFAIVADNCTFNWSCSVEAYDDVYRPLCCNGATVNRFSGTDPLTGQEFNGQNMCAPNWCLADPNLECEDIFEPCNSTASCGRHRFLTANSPATSSDFLLNSIEIIGHGSTGQGYIQCNDVYNEVISQAYKLVSFSSNNANEVPKQHMKTVNDIIVAHCSNPTTRGNGECACINGYGAANVDYAQSFEDDATLQGYQGANLPLMVVQNAKGGYRRVDAYCESGDNWTAPLTYSDGVTTRTISNACSTTVFWNSTTEYTRPTLNPIQSVFSSTNFGDVNVAAGNFTEEGGPSNAMPLHCWLPSCVGSGNGLQNHLVFPDIYALTKTCPSVCYMYSAGDDVDVNDVTGNSIINIGSNFQGCSFDGQGYSSNYNPFTLKKGCEQLYITAPVNFTGIINALVTNPTHDNSVLLQTRLVSAFSNLPQVSFYNNGSISMEFHSQTIYKYNSEEIRGPEFSSTANLQLYVNTSNTSPFTSVQSEIILYDSQKFMQAIPVTLYVYPDSFGSGGTSYTAQVCGQVASFDNLTGAIVCSQTCDCSFGASSLSQNCPEGPTEFSYPERRHIGDELPGVKTITNDSIFRFGATGLLQSFIELYG